VGALADAGASADYCFSVESWHFRLGATSALALSPDPASKLTNMEHRANLSAYSN
jgi:hypothetical protein